MVIYDENVKERLKNDKATPVERFRAKICEAAAKLLPQAMVFYSAQEQGITLPAVFSRLEKLETERKLGGILRMTMTTVLRYLPKRAADDAESEKFISIMAEAAEQLGGYVTAFCGERTDKGAKATLTVCFEQKNSDGDTDGVMRILDLNEL